MKFKIRDAAFGFDADGEPVAGRVSGIDERNGTVTIAPVVCGPVTVQAGDCGPAIPPRERGQSAPAAAAAPTPPTPAPAVPVGPE